jgi:PhzF family phenazine biosynthesis protein
VNGIPIWQVNSFTSTLFRGNPAGVCLLDGAADQSWMQTVAAGINVSETAFLVRRNESEFSIRWFTPSVEVPLCGHATLASAHVLWSAVAGQLEGTTPSSNKCLETKQRHFFAYDSPRRTQPPWLSSAARTQPP